MRKKWIPALIVALIGLLSVSGTTYAYLKYTTEAKVAGIQSGEYLLQVEGVLYPAQTAAVSDASDTEEPSGEMGQEQPAPAEAVQEQPTVTEILLENNSYTFTVPGTAVFTLTASGTASSGYCLIKVTGENGVESEAIYYTDLILAQNSVSEAMENQTETGTAGYIVSMAVAPGTKIEFVPCWGTYNVSEEIKIVKSGEILDFTANAPAEVSDKETTEKKKATEESKAIPEAEENSATTESLATTESTSEAESTSKTESTTETESATETESTTETESATETESTTETESATETESTTETENTTET